MRESFVLVAETSAARIVRLWLKGPKAGQKDAFLESLPAYPDNLSYHDGIFWIALPSPRLQELEQTWPKPVWRGILMRLPHGRTLSPPPYGWVLGVDEQGRVVHNLQDPKGGYATITSVNEIEGWLYLGSIAMSSVGRYPVPER